MKYIKIVTEILLTTINNINVRHTEASARINDPYLIVLYHNCIKLVYNYLNIHALRWSLLIDPQGQGNKWLKTVYRSEMKVIRLSYKTSDYMRSAAQCVEKGLLLLLENVGESLDPVLNPLIKQEYFYQGTCNILITNTYPPSLNLYTPF